MTATYTIATSDNNNGFFTDASAYVHTNGIAMPTGNLQLDSSTLKPIKVYTINAGYQSGGTGLYQTIVYRSVTTAGPQLFTDSGSTFEFRLGKTGGGTMYYGRDSSSSGRNVYFNAGTGTIDWANASLAGTLTYAFVPFAPASLAAVQTARSVALTTTAATGTGFDGYATISAYKVEYRTSTDGTTWGTWGNTQTMTSLAYTYSNLAPATYYQFRTYAVNDVGNSAATVNATTFYVSAGGRVYNGSAWAPVSTFKVYNGTTWVDVTTARVYDGTIWKDITI
jgi:hypothetical protein